MIRSTAARLIRRFAWCESGAVTVEFVVLCGAVVGITLGAANAIHSNVTGTVEASPIPTTAADGS